MQVVLVNLPWIYGIGSYKNIAETFILPIPLALCYLAASIRRKGHTVFIIDAGIEGYTSDQTVKKVMELDPDIIGIGSTSFVHPLAEKLAVALKKVNSSYKIVIGGHHFSALKEDVLISCPAFDVGVYGEGEETFLELVDAFEKKKDLSAVKGIVFRCGDKIVKTSKRQFICSLDDIALPARDLLETEKYFRYKNNRKAVFTNFIVSRGCSFDCVFCGCHNVFGKQVRFRNPTAVVDEIEKCVKCLNIHEFVALDDTFTLNKPQIMEICDQIIARKLNINILACTRVDCVDRDLLYKMKQAGMREIIFGVESGNDEILSKINKKISKVQIREAFDLAKSVGMVTYATAILGHPYETRQTAEDTIEFLSGLKSIDITMLSIMTPVPGTKLYDMAIKGEGGLKLNLDELKKYHRYGGSAISVNDLSSERLVKLQRQGLLRFFLKPARITMVIKMVGFKRLFLLLRNFILMSFSHKIKK